MKKWMCLVLAAMLLFSIAGCATQGEPSKNNSTIPSQTTQSGANTTTKPNDQELRVFKTSVASTSEPQTNTVTDAAGVPYYNISADELTNKQAREILEVLVPRQFDVFFLFQLDHQKIDTSHPLPISDNYALCTDERFSCVQDIKNFILQVYSEEEASSYFDAYLDDDLDCAYLDYNGHLYRNTTVEGKGLNYNEYLADTTRIIARAKDAVTVEMDADYTEDGAPREIYKFSLCKTQNGWRLDSPFLDSYLS